jgi:Pentapeptide repeats (8 copies)
VVGGFLIGPGSGTYLTDADLNGLNLTGVDFSGLTLLRTSFEHANLTKADLDGATVSSTNFTSTVWSDTICPNGTNSDSYAHGRCFAPPPTSPFTVRALPVPVGAPPNDFIPHGISCASATQCWADATYADTRSAGNLPALLHWTGKAWTESEARPTTSQCTVGGGYENTAARFVGLLLMWSGKAWKAAPAPSGVNMVNAISCPTPTRCVAVSQDSRGPEALTGP